MTFHNGDVMPAIGTTERKEEQRVTVEAQGGLGVGTDMGKSIPGMW